MRGSGAAEPGLWDGDDDVLVTILALLPLKALLRCKLVCRRWRHLISDPVFVSDYSRRHARLHSSGFYLQRFLFCEPNPSLKFVSCDPPEESLSGSGRPCADSEPSPANLIEDENGVRIWHSCNGLLLCSSFRCPDDDRVYYICTPPTRQFLPLPNPGCRIEAINIAFDPGQALYRLVCVAASELSTQHRQILVCSSHSGPWRKSGKPFLVSDELLLFERGVFWNGRLHWVGRGRSALRFHVKDEVLMEMPMPPIPEGWSERKLGYFGESGGHLYLVEIYGSVTTAFDVMEMARDYSGWFVKYHVNLEAVARDLARSLLQRNVHAVDAYKFSVLHVVHRQVGEEEECFMVLRIPRGFALYDLKKNTAMDIGDSMPQLMSIGQEHGLVYTWERVFQYMDTFCYL
ncbi:hypothetical protein BT93_F2234 [Corymbia citriodora subsp. variegata]|nr:hypothetical protein BT93_F2234 [Corymbia citriodora subsp. variegata]